MTRHRLADTVESPERPEPPEPPAPPPRRPNTLSRRLRRGVLLAVMMLGFLLVPMGSSYAATVPGCEGEPAPLPEAAGSGADGLLVPPQSAASTAASPDNLPPDSSLYGQYGTSGQQWHVIRESCVDKLGTSAVATLSNTAWDLSKTINQSTITVYQAATSDGLLDNFNRLVENVINELRGGIWQPLLPTVVILGAIWLGWFGLVRKRVTLTVESSVWMVLAMTLGIWILVNPGQILGYASTAVNSGGQLVNSAVSKISVPGVSDNCPTGAPGIEKAAWESDSEFAVRKNSQMLWSGLVCRPWMAGEFGTGPVADIAAEQHGVALLGAQGVSRVELQEVADGDVDSEDLYKQKQDDYEEIAADIENTYPEVYPLFDGSQQGSRLGVATLALFASVFAGGLILAGAVALIVLKIGFLLLLLLSPIFLLIGIHPGYGRTVLLRWLEMMIGLLLKQIFVVLLISLLVMCYGLVMASGLGWGLQMILLALFTVALFIYRKPFAHLFASVNANTFTSRMVNDAMTSNVLGKSANVLPPVAYMRAQRWGLRRAPQLATAAGGVPAGGGGVDPGETAPGMSGAAAPDTGEHEGASVRGETGRVRGRAGYGPVQSKTAPPPLRLGQAASAAPERPQGAPTPRSSAQAPRLGESMAASGGLGGRSAAAPARGAIPPRPAGGYTGVGDTGWSSVFGATGRGPQPASGGGGNSSGGGPADESRPAPSTGRGIFNGRSETPPQGNTIPKGSRWGGAPQRRDRPAPPPRAPRPAPTGRMEKAGNWFKSEGGSRKDQPMSPFWTENGGQQRRNGRRDIPFWLRDED
ncbi:TrbL/VirB6 plasmid conjugal transfer protein [Murinocardiopsis flavida]|uniref:TrbL/VirB6 plasmid conjugal transfer protein n=1 Tax=Murinocardiopsis flavida TaxID=645275 RepID=A0A2P8DJ91_9ACTN|nr:type IV secretion system protein [Murinocardiopsis flavida]PSK97296.1 TrbL/VirB6 plasmid conjugal transfer protein [Murinocardiopsis flavida]